MRYIPFHLYEMSEIGKSETEGRGVIARGDGPGRGRGEGKGKGVGATTEGVSGWGIMNKCRYCGSG